MKKSLKSRVLTVVITATMGLGMYGLTAFAATGNTSTTNFTSSYKPASMDFTYLDTPRAKNVESDVFVYISSSTHTVNVQVCGSDGSVPGANRTLDSGGNPVTSIQVPAGQSARINNDVRYDYNYAVLGFRSSSTYAGGTVNGTWAPDTVS